MYGPFLIICLISGRRHRQARSLNVETEKTIKIMIDLVRYGESYNYFPVLSVGQGFRKVLVYVVGIQRDKPGALSNNCYDITRVARDSQM